MPRISLSFHTFFPVSGLVLFAASSAHANNYSGPVDKAEWAATPVPSYIDMFIALPDVMPEKPPILVNIHSCGNSAGGQWSYDGFAALRDAIDSTGFIMILPQQSRNCWDVGAPEALTHDGGGDTGAIVQMVRYALDKYNGDPTRVYAMGGSGGGMAVQALLAVYPEVFKAGHARAGVPAGCWAESYDDGQQWSGPCAGGSVDKTPQAWGDYVRSINPDYTGPRPRIQINQGDQDETISFKNFQEGIDEWTNVLGLDAMPTRTDSNFQGASATYDRQFWDDACGYTVLETWEALGMGHSMGYEAVHILEFFGLDQKRDQDPWDAACGDMVQPGGNGGAGGRGGASSVGGDTSTSMGGSGTDVPMGGMGASVGGAGGAGGASVSGAGGMAGAATTPGVTPVDTPVGTPVDTAPQPTTAPTVAPTATASPAGTPAPITPVGSTPAPAGSPVAGTPAGTPAASAPGSGSAAPAGSGLSPVTSDDTSAAGCGCIVGRRAGYPVPLGVGLVFGMMGWVLRRRRV